jgi:hypothetical protein
MLHRGKGYRRHQLDTHPGAYGLLYYLVGGQLFSNEDRVVCAAPQPTERPHPGDGPGLLYRLVQGARHGVAGGHRRARFPAGGARLGDRASAGLTRVPRGAPSNQQV